MNEKPGSQFLSQRGGDLVFLLTVAASYVFALDGLMWSFPRSTVVLLMVLGVSYVVVGTHGWGFCWRKGLGPTVSAYFAIEILLGTLIYYLSNATAWLVMLPLAAHAVVILPKRWLVLVCLLLEVAFVIPTGLQFGWRSAVTASLTYPAALLFVVIFTYLAVREEKARTEVERLAAELGEANFKLRAYAVQVEELATAKERNRLAREIHDSLGHYLTAVNMQLEAARAIMGTEPGRASEAMQKAQSLTKEGLADIRRSVAALRLSPVENRSLSQAIESLMEESRATGIIAHLVVGGAPRPLSPQADLTLYRVTQEGLTNVRKHAHASRVDLKLEYGDDARVRLAIKDNGQGTSRKVEGFGLLGLRERVQLLGGECRISSAERQGFTLEVEVPG